MASSRLACRRCSSRPAGWHEDDPEPIVRLHFHGMLNTLHAIATDKYKSTDHQVYDDLPKSNSRD